MSQSPTPSVLISGSGSSESRISRRRKDCIRAPVGEEYVPSLGTQSECYGGIVSGDGRVGEDEWLLWIVGNRGMGRDERRTAGAI